jgi:RecA-family ATPase
MTTGQGAPGNSKIAYIGDRQRAAPRLEPFVPFFAAEIEGKVIKPRDWIVDNVVMAKTVCLFAGPPKSGKSLMIQQLLTAVALGQPWLDRQTKKVKTFGLFAEDPQDELERRQHDILKHYGSNAADLELDFSWIARDEQDSTLIEFEKYTDKPVFTPLWRQMWNYIRDEGVQLVGIDTAGATFGGNENFRRQVTIFMREIVREAARANGAGVILSAHPSKSGPNSYSGSTAWLGSARFAMSMQRPKDYDEETGQPSNTRVLRSLGANYTAAHHADDLRWDKGVFVMDGETRKPLRHVVNAQDRRDLDYRMLAYLRRLVQTGIIVPVDDASAMSLPQRAKKAAVSAFDAPVREFADSVDRLIKSGQVRLVDIRGRAVIRPADMILPGEKEWVTP